MADSDQFDAKDEEAEESKALDGEEEEKHTAPRPIEEELGSFRLVAVPEIPGCQFGILGFPDQFDDGGVGDLSLLIDMDDDVQKRRRGLAGYIKAKKAGLLPQAKGGRYEGYSRRDQKIELAQLLFSEDEVVEDNRQPSNSEIYVDKVEGSADKVTMEQRAYYLKESKRALDLSLRLGEPACTSLSLSEISKRTLTFYGKKGAQQALRCADLACEIAGNGLWDTEEVAIESNDDPTLPPNFERDPTALGLRHPSNAKFIPSRVAMLCMRAAAFQRGNALAALGREKEARESYEIVVPMVEAEHRCARNDWERLSAYINIGNTFSRTGDFESADEKYILAEALGSDHIATEGGNALDGRNMVNSAKRARAFALKKAGREDEAKELLKKVIGEQIQIDMEMEKRSAERAAEEARTEADFAAGGTSLAGNEHAYEEYGAYTYAGDYEHTGGGPQR